MSIPFCNQHFRLINCRNISTGYCFLFTYTYIIYMLKHRLAAVWNLGPLARRVGGPFNLSWHFYIIKSVEYFLWVVVTYSSEGRKN